MLVVGGCVTNEGKAEGGPRVVVGTYVGTGLGCIEGAIVGGGVGRGIGVEGKGVGAPTAKVGAVVGLVLGLPIVGLGVGAPLAIEGWADGLSEGMLVVGSDDGDGEGGSVKTGLSEGLAVGMVAKFAPTTLTKPPHVPSPTQPWRSEYVCKGRTVT